MTTLESRLEEHMGYVVQQANLFHARFGTDVDDLIAAGHRAITACDALYNKTDRNAARPAKFLSYAGVAIRREMQRCVADETGAIRVPDHVWFKAGHYYQTAQPMDTLLDVAQPETTRDFVEREDERAAVLMASADLDETDQYILRRTLEGHIEKTIAIDLGVSKPAVWQRLQKIIRTLRRRLSASPRLNPQPVARAAST